MSKASRKFETKITGAVAEAVKRSDVPAEIPAIAPIAEAVAREIGPEILHATNNEGFIKSWVSMGSSGSIISVIYLAFYHIWTTGDLPPPEIATPLLGVFAGAVIALYGRWVAKKPIGD
jgi:hypothetical protein